MRELYLKHKLFFTILFIVIAGFILWYFSSIVICIVIAGIISIIGFPLVEKMDGIRIGKFKIPHVINVTITLLLIISLVLGLLSFFIPLVIHETNMISTIDWTKLAAYYDVEIRRIEQNMINLGLISTNATFESIIKENLARVVDMTLFSNILSVAVSFAGIFVFHVFSVIFLSFFFLNDHNLLPRVIMMFVPEEAEEKAKNVMTKSKVLLSRYFIGLSINVLMMIASYAIVLTIIGARGSLVIAFVAGMLNIIPYIGPITGVIIGTILGVTGVIEGGLYGEIFPMVLKIGLAMTAVIVIDNVVYGPLIQGKSVKAHPVEIFLVIIAAGSLGGIPAMIVAVPGYAFIRILAGEFLQQFKIGRQFSGYDQRKEHEKIIEEIEHSEITIKVRKNPPAEKQASVKQKKQ